MCNTAKRNNELKDVQGNNFKIKVEGHEITEDLEAKLLGVQFDRTGSYEKHMIAQRKSVMSRLTPLWRITEKLSFKQRKEIAQSRLLSVMNYAQEVITQTSETVLKIMKMTMSQILMWVVNRPALGYWSRSEALRTVGWEDVEINSMYKTVLTARKILLSKQSNELYKHLVNDGTIKQWDVTGGMKNKTKRSFKVRAARAINYLGPQVLLRSRSQEKVKNWLKKLESEKKENLIKIFNGEPIENDGYTVYV